MSNVGDKSDNSCSSGASNFTPLTSAKGESSIPTSDESAPTSSLRTSHLHEHLKRCTRKVDGMVEINNFPFNQDASERELANMIISHDYPLAIVDHVGFRKFSAILQPMFNMPSQDTIMSDILRTFKEERRKTMAMLKAHGGRIGITIDMITADHQKRGYMAVTAHYIYNSWTLQKRIIRFEYVPIPHTKDVIAMSLEKCFLEWNIHRKLSSITVNNCSVKDGVVELLVDRIGRDILLLEGAFFHMHCFACILHLIAEDVLSVIGDGVEKIRDSVLFWGASLERWEKFEETARQLRIPTSKRLSLDCKTQWDSTYLMLQSALFYKDVFSRCMQLHSDPLYTCLPSKEDWERADDICDKLKLFYDISKSLSETKYVTANVYFANICKIRLALNDWAASENAIGLMGFNMLEKFEKYWNVVHGIMGVAVILDPRYKTYLLEYYFEKIYGSKAENEIARIVQIFRDLFQRYQDIHDMDMFLLSPRRDDSGTLGLGNMADYDDFVSKKKRKTSKVFSELDRYLEEDVIPRKGDFDILNWWKVTGPQYPVLQSIVRDIYAIPFVSESTSSYGERLVSAQLSTLDPSTVEALACTRNWL